MAPTVNNLIYSLYSEAGHYYIGSTTIGLDRFVDHRKNLLGNRHCNAYLQNVFNKYGDINIQVIIALPNDFSSKMVRSIEQLFLNACYNDTMNLNLCDKAHGGVSKESATKIGLTKIKEIGWWSHIDGRTFYGSTIALCKAYLEDKLSHSHLRGVVLQRHVQHKGWSYETGRTTRYKNIYLWRHFDGRTYKGSSLELTREFPEERLCNSTLAKVAKGSKYTHHKGWNNYESI